MVDSLSAACLPFSITASFFFVTSPQLPFPPRRFFLAFPRGTTHHSFSSEDDFDEQFHDSNAAHMPPSPPQSFDPSAGPTPDRRRFVGGSRPQLARRFEYERFKELFADKDLEMTEEPANAVGISSLDGGRSRIAQLSESQPSRLHNRFVVFERATESKMVRLSSKRDSRDDDHAKSGFVPPKLPRQKSSYNGQKKSNAKNLGRFSVNLEQEHTGDVPSKSTSSDFSSKLQIILNNFSKRDLPTATEPTDNAAGTFERQVKKNSINGQHEDYWNPSIESTRVVRKDSHASEETHSTFFESPIEDENEKLPDTSAQNNNEARTSSSFNLFSNAPPVPSVASKYSSGSKFLSPIGERSMVASRQHVRVSPRRLSRSIGSRSSPSRSSIPGKFSKYSQRTDLNREQGGALNTSTAESRPSLREEQPRFFFNSKEDLKSHASQELDVDTKRQHSNVDSFTDFEVNVQVGVSAPPVVDGSNHVLPLPQQFRPRSDVEDDMADGPLTSGAVVEANAMASSPESVVSLPKESNSSTMLGDPNLDANVRSLSDDEMSGLHIADAVTPQGAMYSPEALSAQSNLNSSAITDLDGESEQLQKVPLSANSATSQISAKNHPSSDLPFEFQYSYTETPNAPILRYREPLHSPFGPITMDRPWTGRPPPKPSKKKARLFDSFKPPPQGKKGIKYVQDPGPFPEGQSPKAAQTREEILGEPLTKEEVVYLVEKCKNEKRQVNLGRDGLTHNMLDLIQSQWKRRRVCKIKCKGVPTVDMDNVCFHIEDKTGGKIIHRNGGAMFLFRGRNYNYKDRPKIPLMLWKPAAPVYPKLIQQAPGGLTKELARKLRLLGRKTASMCRLGKNGVYLNLVKDVKNAFKVDDLVRIDCRGLNPSDYKKIGAKLRDLVPCVLISFEKEHILMWKGRGWNSKSVGINSENADTSTIDNLELEAPNQSNSSDSGPLDSRVSDVERNIIYSEPLMSSNAAENLVLSCSAKEEISPPSCLDNTQYAPGSSYSTAEDKSVIVNVYDPKSPSQVKNGSSGTSQDEVKGFSEEITALWQQALELGMASEIDADLDTDCVFHKADELAKTAPPGPTYTVALLKQLRLNNKKRVSDGKSSINIGRTHTRQKKKQVKQVPEFPLLEAAPMGGLPVDELARLLAPK